MTAGILNDKEEGMKSDCHGADMVMQYKVLKDGHSLGKGYKVCSKCHESIRKNGYKGNLKFWMLVGILLEPELRKLKKKRCKPKKEGRDE